MHILVLDTIHGGKTIARALEDKGHVVDMVDVYRGREGISPADAMGGAYDLVVAPVHLYPRYPLLVSIPAPAITHHQAVRWLIGKDRPSPFIEITGTRGKTTTGTALAHVMKGAGVLHTSTGTFRYPGRVLHNEAGITPGSLIAAAVLARSIQGWLIAEVSLGFTGAGCMGILTSSETYRFAGGERDAREEKLRSGSSLPILIGPRGEARRGNMIPVSEIARVEGDTCHYEWGDIRGKFSNSLLECPAYQDPLAMAAAAACILGIDPFPLSTFSALKGRLSLSWHKNCAVIDDSNSGTCAATARQAITYARRVTKTVVPLTLVIGKEEGAICEGFPGEDIVRLIEDEHPSRVIIVGEGYEDLIPSSLKKRIPISICSTLDEGQSLALHDADRGTVVLAVKTWR